MAEVMLAIGLMSGTSRDGIDAALIETDGLDHVRPLAFLSQPYEEAVRDMLEQACSVALTLASPTPHEAIDLAADEVTALHVDAARRLLDRSGRSPREVGVVGFHGHTVAHRPDRGWTWQIGDAPELARALGIAVVGDLRSADVAAGGQGAPFLPVYHRALAAGLPKPAAILNLGGVANITFIGEAEESLIAFDTGMANAMIDDWVKASVGMPYDEGGRLAATGKVDEQVLERLLDHPYFSEPPPKSLERAAFTLAPLQGLQPADGAATLAAFSAKAVGLAMAALPARPKRIYVAGGGRHNATLMRMIGGSTGLELVSVDELGWNGDAIEAQGFAYMAVRTLTGLPISFPGTTGAARPMPGGRVHCP
jgi:anhydro-N-acetylmuramic acid kinase